MQKKDTAYKIMVIVSFVILITINVLSSVGTINGKTMSQISDSYLNLLTPARYTFLIWGIIYLFLTLLLVYQMGVHRDNKDSDEILQYARIVLITTNLLNISWIVAWHYDYLALSVIIALAMLITLKIFGKLMRKEYLNFNQKILIRFPFSVYYGWITIVYVINIIILLKSIRWKGFGIPEQYWMIGIIAMLTVLVVFRTIRNKDIIYCAAFIWAYIGIMTRHISHGMLEEASLVITGTLCVGVLILVGCVLYLFINRKHRLLY